MALALCLASATLLGGARAGGAFADGVEAAAPVPERARAAGEIPVGDDLEVSGQPMRLSIFHTPDRPSRVVAFHADAFRARGLLPVLSGLDALAHVSAFDPLDGLQRFASALAQPDGRTLVITGTVDPRRPAHLLHGPAVPALPLPPDHRAFLGFRSRDGEARAESGQFFSGLPAREVESFYRQALGRDGYVENAGPGEDLLLFGKPGAIFSVAARTLGASAGSAVFVTLVEGGPR
jgi:hypothetical protein